jgi:transcriptional regulator with XRE-family HTH domain
MTTHSMPRRIGRVIAAARVLADLSQTELAQKMGTHQGEISRVESGKGTLYRTLQAWCALGLKSEDFNTVLGK